MEIETWYLGMFKFLERSNPKYTEESISTVLGVDIAQVDPEDAFFHPADELDKIFTLDGNRYRKRESDIESILSNLEGKDFDDLYASEKYSSFNRFTDELLAPVAEL